MEGECERNLICKKVVTTQGAGKQGEKKKLSLLCRLFSLPRRLIFLEPGYFILVRREAQQIQYEICGLSCLMPGRS